MQGTAKGVFVISFMLALGAVNAAMAGIIEGTVKDSKTGQPLISAMVRVVGPNLGATTDLDGKFKIADVPPGVYSVRISYVNYLQKVMPAITVTGSDVTTLEITLETAAGTGDAMRIDDTYVTADAIRSNIISLLNERARSSSIQDGISSEQIRLSPAGDASDALKRVTGLSIVDDKFVFVRGVTDRYNSTMLNGASVTSTDTDTDKKSFSFDMIPSSLISNTVVSKTATPDQPGDFSGGLVQVNTLDFPSKFLVAASAEMGSDHASSRKDIRMSQGGGSDWKAEDDGSRAKPPDLEGVELAQALPNTWGSEGGESNMNGSYVLALGNSFNVSDGQIGFIASGTYKNSYKVENYHQQPEAAGLPLFSYDGTRYKHKYLWGGMGNLSWKPSGNHRISFENNYSRSAEDKVTQAEGINEAQETSRTQNIEWDQRDIYLGQFKGAHTLSFARGLEIEWRGSYSTSEAAEPDRKYAQYSLDPRGNYLIKDNLRTWSELSEDTRGGQVDLEFPLGEGFVKTGYLQTTRERDFNVNAYTTETSVTRPNQGLLILPIDEVFAPENYGEGKFDFLPVSDNTGVYHGTSDLNCYYGMADEPFRIAGRGFRIAGGARVEDNKMEVTSPKSTTDKTLQTSVNDNTDVLPSANLTAQVTDTSNLRFGYYSSVNRPEFREMANVVYLDLDANQYVLGNPELERALIRNYDVRVEWFPAPSEVLAVSYFYKDLSDAIEERLLPAPDRYVRTWFNSPTGKNFGYEIELRKSLGFATGSLENLVVQGNYTHVDSEVEYTESLTDEQGNAITTTRKRPLQGQAPYTLNAGLTYSMPDIGLSLSLLYNKFGRRLDAVGETRDEDIYEESRELLDFALTEQFTSWMRLKFTVKDILAQDAVFTFGSTGSTWESIEAGTTYALSLSFSL